MSKIAAIIVTFNREKFLIETLKALLNQDKALDTIIIVNNASTDNTKNTCENFISMSVGVNIVLLNNDKNLGGAGGFYKGMEYCIVSGAYEYLWLMDDDVVPDKECLSNLLEYKEFSEFIHPSRYYEDGSIHRWNQMYVPALGHSFTLKEPEAEVYSVNVGCFEGCLIKTSLVRRLGMPFKDFFICEDDTLYGFLASFYTPVILVRKAKIKRLIKTKLSLDPWKVFYIFRNKIWMLKIIYRENLAKKRFFYNISGLFIFFLWFLIFNKFKGWREALKGVFCGIFKNPD